MYYGASAVTDMPQETSDGRVFYGWYEAGNRAVPDGGGAVAFLPSCQCRCYPACEPALSVPCRDEGWSLFAWL